MNHWSDHILNPAAPVDVDTISETVEAIMVAICTQVGPDRTVPNIMFTKFMPNKVSAEHLATALRVTYRWRHENPTWEYGLKVAHVACILQNVDPRDVLFGMLKAL